MPYLIASRIPPSRVGFSRTRLIGGSSDPSPVFLLNRQSCRAVFDCMCRGGRFMDPERSQGSLGRSTGGSQGGLGGSRGGLGGFWEGLKGVLGGSWGVLWGVLRGSQGILGGLRWGPGSILGGQGPQDASNSMIATHLWPTWTPKGAPRTPQDGPLGPPKSDDVNEDSALFHF